MKKEYRSVARTKKRIREAFIQLLGEKKNMEAITVSELAERADIAKSTFYNHYDDIYAVIEEFDNELINKLSAVFAEMEQDRSAKYEDYLRKITAFVKSNEDLYRKALLSPDVRFFVEKLKNFLTKKIFERNISLSFSQDKNERYVQVRFLVNAYVNTMVDCFSGNLNATLDEVSETIISMLNKFK